MPGWLGRDLIATILDADEDDFDIEVDYVLPDEAGQLVREAKTARAWLEAAQAFRDYAQATERLQERVAELAFSLSQGLEGA